MVYSCNTVLSEEEIFVPHVGQTLSYHIIVLGMDHFKTVECSVDSQSLVTFQVCCGEYIIPIDWNYICFCISAQ